MHWRPWKRFCLLLRDIVNVLDMSPLSRKKPHDWDCKGQRKSPTDQVNSIDYPFSSSSFQGSSSGSNGLHYPQQQKPQQSSSSERQQRSKSSSAESGNTVVEAATAGNGNKGRNGNRGDRLTKTWFFGIFLLFSLVFDGLATRKKRVQRKFLDIENNPTVSACLSITSINGIKGGAEKPKNIIQLFTILSGACFSLLYLYWTFNEITFSVASS
jgi:hypothetical protein